MPGVRRGLNDSYASVKYWGHKWLLTLLHNLNKMPVMHVRFGWTLLFLFSWRRVVGVTSSASRRSLDDVNVVETTRRASRPRRRRRRLRSLQASCPNNSSLTTDGVWYELNIQISSEDAVVCTDAEWSAVRLAMEETLANADLWDNGLNILNLNPHICNNPTRRNQRRIQADNAAAAANNNAEQHDRVDRDLIITAQVYHSVHQGGGKCFFCRPEDQDAGGRRLVVDKGRGVADAAKPAREPPPTSIQQERRRRLDCGGCFFLDFNTRGDGSSTDGTPYLRQKEYWQSHGVRIRAYGGYAPDNKARVLDTTASTSGNLGSPNNYCPGGGGPGIGTGGQPNLPNGQPNPGANCDGEGHVMIIQHPSYSRATADDQGGKLVINFRYPVNLESIGLMDMDEGSGDYVVVHMEDGTTQRHNIAGFGDNSIQEMELNHRKVIRLAINFPGSGALRFLRFCHDCGEDEAQRAEAIDDYYPPDSERLYENQDSVNHFESLLPGVNSQLTALLQAQLDQDFVADPSSCLHAQNATVNAQLLASTPVDANSC